MDSPQSVVSPLKKNSSILPEPEKQNGNLVKEINFQAKGTTIGNSDDSSLDAALEVCIHQARDIHNICIYQNQDVYAKLCLTSDPENTVSTKIINGGGRNPIFNENLCLNVRKVDSSLKCEIWMLSRVRNYMEDQLLGFALVPVSEVIVNDGKLEKEFSLSSTDLFHSPAGFVQLSVSYIGAPPEVIPLPSPPTLAENDASLQEMEYSKSLSSDLDKIEFPDPIVANENNQMVEEYIAMPCSNCDTENRNGENFSILEPTAVSPLSSVTTNPTATSEGSPPFSSQSCETPKESKIRNEENFSPNKDNDAKQKTNEVESNIAVVKPLVSVDIEREESKVVQQDIVDMYMKSMQQFTESLAKMKLPMDFESGPTSSGNSSSDPKSSSSPASKNSGSRVFYGSRAFF